MKEKTSARLMVIGGTWEQEPLIKAAKEMGCYVLATDGDEKSAGLRHADETKILDPRDLPQALKIARDFDPDGITADECDYSHYAAVYASVQLGLPNAGLSAAQLTTNKLWMRLRCRDHHITQPRFFPCHTIEEATSAADVIGWPVIVKPVDNRGAFGVNVAHDEGALAAAFLDALMNAHSREVIVEAYIEGTHITVDGCVDQQGVHHNLAIASKKVTPGDKPIIVGVVYPAEIPDDARDYVLNTNSKVITALGITGGLTHSEYIVDEKGRCFLVETANRGGGVLTSAKIVPAVSGVDVSRLLINNALGLSYDVEPRMAEGVVMLTFFVFPPGKVKSIRNVDKAKALPGVVDLFMLIDEGQELVPPMSGAGRHGFVILQADNMDGIVALRGCVLDTILIEYS